MTKSTPTPVEALLELTQPSPPVMIRQTSMPTNPAMYKVALPYRTMTVRVASALVPRPSQSKALTKPASDTSDDVLAVGD